MDGVAAIEGVAEPEAAADILRDRLRARFAQSAAGSEAQARPEAAPKERSAVVPPVDSTKQAQNLFAAKAANAADSEGSNKNLTTLSDEEQAVVRELQARDSEVRRHEEAHARVGGQYAGQPSYSYQMGPDGKQYAIGGEVAIDVAPVPDDPEATIAKMEVVKAAALAPAEPSGQDRKVAALADAQRTKAIGDLADLRSAAKEAGDAAG